MATSPFCRLPVELIARIFHLGVLSAPHPDHVPAHEPSFEVLVSHVCRYWRAVALSTPSLWAIIVFRYFTDLDRAQVYLSRTGSAQLLDIHVDTCAENEHVPGLTLFRDEFQPVFDIVVPHIARWRSLSLKVRDLICKGGARAVLSTCGPAPHLEHLQLWHIQDWGTAEGLFNAIGPPPVIVFNGSLPSLSSLSLIGVNVPWAQSPFLTGLCSLELALHSDDVRIPYPIWYRMLEESPHLERLSLHYSGPRSPSGGAGGPLAWDPPQPVRLVYLHELRLTDLDPPYLVMLFRTLDIKALRRLFLELENQDFSIFLDFLVRPLRPVHDPLVFSDPAVALAYDAEYNGGNGGRLREPFFPVLRELSIAALECSVEAWTCFMRTLKRVRRVELDLKKLPDGFFDVLFVKSDNPDAKATIDRMKVREEVEAAKAAKAQGASRFKGKGKERALEEDDDDQGSGGNSGGGEKRLLLPALEEVRISNVALGTLWEFAAFRRAVGKPVKRWEVDERVRDVDAKGESEDRKGTFTWDALESSMKENGEQLIWVRADDEDGDDDEDEDDEDGDDGDDGNGLGGDDQGDADGNVEDEDGDEEDADEDEGADD